MALLTMAAALSGCDSTGPAETAPEAPEAVLATTVSESRITLAWSLDDPEVDRIELERAPIGGSFAPLATVGGSTRSFTDDGLTPATTYRYRLRACEGGRCSPFSAEASATTPAMLTLAGGVLPSAIAGIEYSAPLSPSGAGGALTFQVASGHLPPGLRLTPEGRIEGIPAAPGRYVFEVRVTSEDGRSASAELSIHVRGRLVITTRSLPAATVGVPYNVAIRAEGGDSTYTWFVDSGTLPVGLTISETGLVTGIPDIQQTTTFVARVRSGDGQTEAREFTIPVGGSGEATIVIRTTLLPPGTAGLRYNPLLEADAVNDAPITWSIVSGSLPPGVSLAANGGISGVPAVPGTYTVTMHATSNQSVAQASYTVRVVPNDTGRFNLTRFDVSPVPPALEPHVTAAFARWERVIVGNLPVDSIPRGFFGPSSCGGFGDDANGAGIDDVMVIVNIDAIDGPGGVLGQAGPCAFREADNLTGIGVLTLDETDLEQLVGTETLTDIVFHEIGHILGIGTLWDCVGTGPNCNDYLEGEGGDDPRFSGPRAVAEWRALGGSGNVPVENMGGGGTALSHWREVTFEGEIMTGFVEPVGSPNPLSRLTIASLEDLGFPVAYGEADPFSLPAGIPLLRAFGPLEPGWEIGLPEPPRRLSDR